MSQTNIQRKDAKTKSTEKGLMKTRKPQPSLSIILITLNEQRNIIRCLGSVRFSKKVFPRQEIIVVDAESQDQTVKIARTFGAKVFVRRWKGYTDQKNWALAKAKGDWILSLDADEEMTPKLTAEIEAKALLADAEVNGFWIKRKTFFLDKWMKHCGWWPDFQLRLVRQGKSYNTNEPLHAGLEVTGQTLQLNEPMNHYPVETVHQYLEKINRYSALDVMAMKPKKKKYWPYYLTVAPLMTFIRTFISRQGYKDGWHGLVLCGLDTFHDFCRYAKLWEKEILKRHE